MCPGLNLQLGHAASAGVEGLEGWTLSSLVLSHFPPVTDPESNFRNFLGVCFCKYVNKQIKFY